MHYFMLNHLNMLSRVGAKNITDIRAKQATG